MEEKIYTADQILNFKEEDWNFRRSSGYAGYDHKDTPGNEQTWIYERDFSARRSLKAEFEKQWKLLHDFRLDCLPYGEYPDYVLRDFLFKKLFKTD